MKAVFIQRYRAMCCGENLRGWTLVLKLLLLTIAGGYIAMYLWMVVIRCQYPFELEWIEGAMVDIVHRVVEGKSIYVAPSLEFVPFLYPPVYFYLSALVTWVTGAGLLPLRLVSIAASLVSMAVIYLIVWENTYSSLSAWLAVGLFTASYRVTGAWLDIARVDSLFLAWFLLFVYCILHAPRSNGHLFAAGLFAALAFLTKQTALITCLPIMIFLAVRNFRKGLLLLGLTISLVGLVSLYLNLATDGWYAYYVFNLLGNQTEWIPSVFSSFWTDDLIFHLPVAVVLGVFFFTSRLNQQDWKTGAYWFFILVGALVGSFITRVKLGGYDNVLLPLYAIMSILIGLGFHSVLSSINGLPVRFRAELTGAIYVAGIFQLAILIYNPFAQIPTLTDRAASNRLVQLIADIPGEVYLPYHGYLSTLAGKETYAHHSATWDIMRGEQDDPAKKVLQQALDRAIQEQFFTMILLDSNWHYLPRIPEFYERAGWVFPDQVVPVPVTGLTTYPKVIYLPIDREEYQDPVKELSHVSPARATHGARLWIERSDPYSAKIFL